MKNPIDLAAQAAAFADKYNMLPQGSTVLCALSGGADSMALLSVLEALAKPRSLTLHAAHFNHQLRGEESQRDEDFVVQWCQKRGIPLVVGRGDVAQEAQEQGKGVEETARAMRYGFLTATAQELGADKIATAHNADDNAETLLLHLARGTGLDGLTGIPPVRGILIRPLLATPRIDIAVYLAQEEIPHVEDSSNQDTVYARNRLRQEVMPVLRDLNPAFVSTLAANLVHLREDRDLTQKEVAELTGLGLTTIHKFENGTAGYLSLSTFLLLLKVVGQIDAINDVLPELPPSPYLMRKDEKKAQRIRHTKR